MLLESRILVKNLKPSNIMSMSLRRNLKLEPDPNNILNSLLMAGLCIAIKLAAIMSQDGTITLALLWS